MEVHRGGRAGNKHLTQREAAVRNSEAVQRPVYNEVCSEGNAPSVIKVQLTLACGCQLPIFHHNTSEGLKAMETRKKNIGFEIFCQISAEPIKLSAGMRSPIKIAGKCEQ